MGKFVISMRKNGEYQFSLHAANGEIILVSEGYTGKGACRKGIESVQKNSLQEKGFDRKKAVNDKFYFNLRARNGKVIATSEMYGSAAAMENGIKSVMTNARIAGVDDQTLEKKPA